MSRRLSGCPQKAPSPQPAPAMTLGGEVQDRLLLPPLLQGRDRPGVLRATAVQMAGLRRHGSAGDRRLSPQLSQRSRPAVLNNSEPSGPALLPAPPAPGHPPHCGGVEGVGAVPVPSHVSGTEFILPAQGLCPLSPVIKLKLEIEVIHEQLIMVCWEAP